MSSLVELAHSCFLGRFKPGLNRWITIAGSSPSEKPLAQVASEALLSALLVSTRFTWFVSVETASEITCGAGNMPFRGGKWPLSGTVSPVVQSP